MARGTQTRLCNKNNRRGGQGGLGRMVRKAFFEKMRIELAVDEKKEPAI